MRRQSHQAGFMVKLTLVTDLVQILRLPLGVTGCMNHSWYQVGEDE